ncbi:RNase P subunit p29-like protein [Cystobasidium minutum MCA 4210]|uniref:RNase P subunit p29-like protein n=1 Tax=Cystobasidium minutum MCA 4210 TaxID=1397322 RepID=UPI0034CF4DFE|eukprot:jgi/Rhomi1/181021/fgenesh1_pg.5_\
MNQQAVPLTNPRKQSKLAKTEKERAQSERRKQKIANKRRRSGRLVKSDLKGVPPGTLSTSRPLLKGQVSYELLKPLTKLWLGYIAELLNLELRKSAPPEAQASVAAPDTACTSTSRQAAAPSAEQEQTSSSEVAFTSKAYTLHQMQVWQSKLVKADFHGCEVEVVKAKHPSLVGLTGIVAQETEGTLRIVTPRNLVKVIPKSHVTFAFSLPLPPDQEGNLKDLRFELLGSNFVFRGADRASKKFKAKGAKGLDY